MTHETLINSEGEKLVFIIGIARTGSKIYLNMLRNNTDIDVVNELHYLAPWWVRDDFLKTTQERFGSLNTEKALWEFVEFLYSGELQGTFWKQNTISPKNKSGIIDLNKQTLFEKLLISDRSYKSILRIILEEHALSKGKQIGGAKFPVNIASVPQLMSWFPKAKYIHLIRDPRAVYASMLTKAIVRKSNGPFDKILYHGKILAYLFNQYRHAAIIHRNYSNSHQYCLSRFEDMVKKPKENTEMICNFLNVDFKDGMLTPNVTDSSFKANNTTGKGLDISRLTEWNNHLGSISKKVIETYLSREMSSFRYV